MILKKPSPSPPRTKKPLWRNLRPRLQLQQPWYWHGSSPLIHHPSLPTSVVISRRWRLSFVIPVQFFGCWLSCALWFHSCCKFWSFVSIIYFWLDMYNSLMIDRVVKFIDERGFAWSLISIALVLIEMKVRCNLLFYLILTFILIFPSISTKHTITIFEGEFNNNVIVSV